MFDDQHKEQDLMFRSILENGQEEVPARVWDGVASGLDQMARRKKVALWWSGAAASVAAAAAVAVGVVLNHRTEDFVLPDQEGIVAVIEGPVSASEDTLATIEEAVRKSTYLAYAPAAVRQTPRIATENAIENATENATVDNAVSNELEQENTSADQKTEKAAAPENNFSAVADEWEDDKPSGKRKIKVSLVLSSTTGANGASKAPATGLLKRPMKPNAITKTGVTEIGDNRYGLPLSFGVGAKIDLTQKWSVGVGVNYSLLSRKFKGEYLNVDNGNIIEYTQSDIRNLQHYIGIPVNAYYNIINKNKVNFYAYAGGAVEKCVANEYQILETKRVHKEKARGVQWSANVGVGVEFMLGEHVGLYLDPSARYYFNNRQPKSIRTSQPFMVGFELGLRTRF